MRHSVALIMAIIVVGRLAAADPSSAPPTREPTVAATVNGEVIRLAEVDDLIRREFRPTSPLTTEQTRDIRTAVVEDRIDDVLLKQFLREHGPDITPTEVDVHLKALALSLRQRRQTLDQYYAASGRTEADVRDTWTNLLRFQKYIDARATEDELREYHTRYKDLFDRASVKASWIVVRVPAGSPPGVWTTARQTLTRVKGEILAGKIEFTAAARQYSVDPVADVGGELGWIARKDALIPEAVTRAAFSLVPGGISEPIDTPHGVAIVRVTDRRAGTPVPFEQVADLVRECYTEDVRQNLVRQLREKAAIQVAIP